MVFFESIYAWHGHDIRLKNLLLARRKGNVFCDGRDFKTSRHHYIIDHGFFRIPNADKRVVCFLSFFFVSAGCFL